MKKIFKLVFLVFLILSFNYCKNTETLTTTIVYTDSLNSSDFPTLIIDFKKGKSFNHPTYVVWIEDLQGNYIKTIYITKSYASGIFNFSMKEELKWLDKPGKSFQPAALPYWTFKKGPIFDKKYVPTPEHPFVDAYIGATPDKDFKFCTQSKTKLKTYRVLAEVNQTWDWNNYWTNNKFPESYAYKNSAQPSLIFSTTIHENDTVFYLNPIGHGDPKGESNKLFTDISTLTSAKDIFKSISVRIQKESK